MKLKGKKVFITGAGGFIGSHLTERLVMEGCKVTALVHYNSLNSWANLENIDSKIKKEINVISGDILDTDFLREHIRGKDVVFHLAALISIPYSYQAPGMFVNTNVLGSTNVFQASRDNDVERVIHTSTSETYGSALYVPIDEKHPIQAQSPYSASKVSADRMAESYYKSFKLPVVTVRPFNTFGPRQSARAIIPTVISQFAKSNRIKLGSLFPVRDLNYVENTVEGFIRCAQSDKAIGEVINIGYGSGHTIGDLVKKIASIMKLKDFKITTDSKRLRPKKSEVSRLICSYSKAKKLTGYKPVVSFEEGLKRTVEWIELNKDCFKADTYNV